jgi:hypothetical protein
MSAARGRPRALAQRARTSSVLAGMTMARYGPSSSKKMEHSERMVKGAALPPAATRSWYLHAARGRRRT